MPLAGKGMLLTSMDIDPADEADFNRWYDREHLIERVAIDGFLEARRYVAHQGSPKYLCLYSTESFEVLDSPAYRKALLNPTDWSQTNLARCENIMRPRPAEAARDPLRASLRDQLDPGQRDGIISMHLIESDPALSKPLTDDPPVSDPGAGDWFVLIDATNVNAVFDAMAALAFEGGIKVSAGS